MSSSDQHRYCDAHGTAGNRIRHESLELTEQRLRNARLPRAIPILNSHSSRAGAEGIGSADTVSAAADRRPHANENRQFLSADCYMAGVGRCGEVGGGAKLTGE
jgi:hypothetical protein